jgi:hypothetical protein
MEVFGTTEFGGCFAKPPTRLIDTCKDSDEIGSIEMHRVAVFINSPIYIEATFILYLVRMIVGIAPIVGI